MPFFIEIGNNDAVIITSFNLGIGDAELNKKGINYAVF